MGDEEAALLQRLIDVVDEISAISDYRCTVKKEYCNLARRLKLLIPMFEELRDGKKPVSTAALRNFKEALESAKELLRLGSEGSKIYLVLERDRVITRFHEVTAHLEQALDEISIEKLDLSDEVKEQVELVHAQFKRAKGRVETFDFDIHEDLLSLYDKEIDASTDITVVKKLAEKLQLMEIADLTQESLALHELVSVSGGDPGASIEKMSMLLKKIKEYVLTQNPELLDSAREKSTPSSCGGASARGSQKKIAIPDDFRCPISLELIRDPVIVSTGQTYERSCIEKWLEAGHGTCPKTQQTLTNTNLTPNYVLRSLIAQWCETNGIEPPKQPSACQNKSSSTSSPAERDKIETLIHKLKSISPEEQRSAAYDIRLLAKRNAHNRIAIAQAGAIPILIGLLSESDSRTQEHAVTALLNLSICEENKGRIISCGAVPAIVHVLKKGSMEARENAAATLFSLSVLDENKVIIGGSGAIPPLVTLLSEGTQRGRKDAATALFNLCIYQGNKGKAVRAGVIPTLMRLITEPQGTMVDEALAVLAILSSHSDGKSAIGAAEAVPVLVEMITNGSPRNKENAAAILAHLCSGDQKYLLEAREVGVMGPLVELSQSGTDRGKRKAAQLIERMKQAQA